jgi:hypothetical protein
MYIISKFGTSFNCILQYKYNVERQFSGLIPCYFQQCTVYVQCTVHAGKWCNAWVLENRTKLRITNLDIMMRSWCILAVKSSPHSKASYWDFSQLSSCQKWPSLVLAITSCHNSPAADVSCHNSSVAAVSCFKLPQDSAGCQKLFKAASPSSKLCPTAFANYRLSEAVWSCPLLFPAFRGSLNQPMLKLAKLPKAKTVSNSSGLLSLCHTSPNCL